MNMNAVQKHTEYHDFINLCELKMSETPLVLEPVHKFAPGIYRRELFVPAGAFITSKVHLTKHFFELITGVMDVATQDGIMRMVAPYDCITEPGTRKIAFVIEDAIMVTYHDNPDGCTDIEVIEERLFKAYDNPLLKEAKMEEINA
jgi:hypothetical protein